MLTGARTPPQHRLTAEMSEECVCVCVYNGKGRDDGVKNKTEPQRKETRLGQVKRDAL